RRRSPTRSTGHYESALVCERDESCAVVAIELAQDVAYMGLCGQRADDEPASDLVVGKSASHEQQDVALAAGQLGQCRRGRPRVAARGELSAISRRVMPVAISASPAATTS